MKYHLYIVVSFREVFAWFYKQNILFFFREREEVIGNDVMYKANLAFSICHVLFVMSFGKLTKL